MKRIVDDSPRCSFCRKTQGEVRNLFSNPNPNDYPRPYICDECVAVCTMVIERDKVEPEEHQESPPVSQEHPLLSHPLASSLMEAIENWLCDESLGKDAAPAFRDMRRIAIQMLSDSGRQLPT